MRLSINSLSFCNSDETVSGPVVSSCSGVSQSTSNIILIDTHLAHYLACHKFVLSKMVQFFSAQFGRQFFP